MRSGHHAVMDGIYHVMNKNKMFINNCNENGGFHYFTVNDEKPSKEIPTLNTLGEYLNGDYNILYNFEHKNPNSKWIEGWGGIKADYNVIVLRDPYNWLASAMAMNKKYSKIYAPLDIDLWIEHAKYFVSENESPNLILIKYNQWIVDVEYRKEILLKMGLKYDDSYDLSKFKDNPSSFNIKKDFDKRWKLYKNNKTYLTKIKNKKLYNLSNEIFNFTPINYK